ncbi:MAG TPA: tetratricopeptide repeat protein, partial [Gemmatimonadales bacterium]|nr:tetratricopeptide repeat protein [Gemmatimonadales bacterium]
HVTQAPEPVTRRRPAVPPALGALVMQCLEKRPADRPQTADEITRRLEAIAAEGRDGGTAERRETASVQGDRPVHGAHLPPSHRPAAPSWHRAVYLVLGFLLALGAAWTAMRARGGGRAPTNEHRIVVLPFENLGDSNRLYFANGVTEAITTQLTGIGGLSVIPRSTAARFRGTTKSVSEIGRELGVGYVLTGTVQWDEAPGRPPRVRVSPELVRVADTSSVWAHGYDTVVTSVFQVYGDVSTAVAQALEVTLDAPARRALARRPTANAEAYDLYLRAIDYANRGNSRDNFEAAIPMLERAVALDPAFALAWGRLSETLALAHWLYFRHTAATMARAKTAAERALALQPELPEAHRAMGNYWYRVRDYPQALREFAVAQRARPNDAELVAAIGFVERRQGRWAAALADLQRSMALDPGSALIIGQVAETMSLMGRFDESIALCRRGIEVGPDQPDAYLTLVLNQLRVSGDVAAAAGTVRRALGRMPAVRFLAGVDRVPAFVAASDDSLARAFLALAPGEGGADPYAAELLHGDILRLRGRAPEARAAYDSARAALEGLVGRMPDDYGYHAQLGLTYARLGRAAEAVHEGRRAVELLPPERDAYFGVNNVINLAQIHAALGQAGPAVRQLRLALAGQPFLTPAWLRVDPAWDPIRRDPAFQQLLATGRIAG